MTGGSETAETAAWLRKYPASTLGPVQVYKSIHHGAANGDNLNWLKVVRPSNVVISVGPNNYGHPTSTALNLYRSVGATTYRTDLNGTVTVAVQPSGAYTITTERGVAQPPAPAPGGLIKSPVPVTPPPARDSSPVLYRNCAEARAAGAAPLLRGQPGYNPSLDRDGDGKACE
ncbi:metallo-beta-lactamase superfamily hydrolase (plasmid) [Deinococcus wulumuqiensis]|uniref:Metallo-beta-lactamase superfamily hydrolase n=2 Tax=Deinococcus wulumuqiensis TaxID=980427 RepID=A0A345ILF2_9DEIO|nr:metallo-beta-lactamase superfamily hydrolase [Deinococcus wulumuqiensis]